MARWYGIIGYAEPVETEPGIWDEKITEYEYTGDSFRNTRLLQSSDSTNDNINVGNQISFVADPYAMEHFHWMRYVDYMGARWKVSNVEVQYPRLILTIGGLYN